jgi:hypothetical protein
VVSIAGFPTRNDAKLQTTESHLLRPHPRLPLSQRPKPLPLLSDQYLDLPPEEETPTEDEELPEVEGPKASRGTLDPQVETSRKDLSTPLDSTASESVGYVLPACASSS